MVPTNTGANVMAAWLDSIMSPLNAAGHGIEKLIKTRDFVKFGDELRKLHAEILAAQRGAMTAQTNEVALLEEVGKLKKRVAELEAWDSERRRYERRNVGLGAFAYVLKKTERNKEEPHWACTNCYEHGKIITLQLGRPKVGPSRWFCPTCKNEIDPNNGTIEWPKD
jgi:rubrerythrin